MKTKRLLGIILLLIPFLLPSAASLWAEENAASEADALTDLEAELGQVDSAPPSISSEPLPDVDLDRELTELDRPVPTPAPVIEKVKASEPEPVLAEPKVVTPDPVPVTSAPPAAVETQWSNEKNEISNLEFKMEEGISRVLVSSHRKLNYREVKNTAAHQIVYFFENTVTPTKLQRAYDTTEFPSPISLFTLLQMPQTTPVLSKLIIQLREDKVPNVVNTDRGMYIDFPASDSKVEPRLLLNQKEGEEDGEQGAFAMDHKFTGKPIQRLEIKNSDIQDVLRLIAKHSGYNIVIGEDVTGKVGAMSIENIPWDQAFALILQSKKLGYVKNGNVLRIATLASLKAEKEETIANEQSRVRAEPLKTLLIPISYAKASEISPRAKPLLSDRGTLDVDDRTNTVIVRDVAKVTERVQKLYAALDNQPPTVNVSAKFVEMTSNFTRSIGLNAGTFSTSPFSGLNLDHQLSYGSGGSYLGTLTAPQFGNLTAEFALGEVESKVKTLANPSLSMNSNQSGSITQGLTLNFYVPGEYNPTTGYIPPRLNTVTTNLTLNVTPIVSGDGAISMKVNITNQIPIQSGNNVNVQSRNVDTNILVNNGDTAVIGGVFRNTVTSGMTGTPFLDRLPILGYLFSSRSSIEEKAEIMIFLTAKVLNADEAFKRTL